MTVARLREARILLKNIGMEEAYPLVTNIPCTSASSLTFTEPWGEVVKFNPRTDMGMTVGRLREARILLNNVGMKRHIQSVHNGIRYPCPHCDHQATTKGNLKTHIKYVHDCGTYPCPHCDHQATQKAKLKTHIKSVHDGIRYPCPHCDYQARTNGHLKAHIKSVHEGIKHPCPHCDHKAT